MHRHTQLHIHKHPLCETSETNSSGKIAAVSLPSHPQPHFLSHTDEKQCHLFNSEATQPLQKRERYYSESTSRRGRALRCTLNWKWQSSQKLVLEAESQCSKQLRWMVPSVPAHSHGDRSSSCPPPSWQILHMGLSTRALEAERDTDALNISSLLKILIQHNNLITLKQTMSIFVFW